MNAKVSKIQSCYNLIMGSVPLLRDALGRPESQVLAHLSTVYLTVLAGTA